MTTIKEITETSSKGRIDRYFDVRRILAEFLETPLGELFAYANPERKNLLGSVLQYHGLRKECIDRITYPELLCLIDGIEDDDYEDPGSMDATNEEYKRCLVEQLKRLLLEAGKANFLVREFLAISIDAMYSCLEIMVGMANRRRLAVVFDYEPYKRRRSLKEALEETTEISKSSWCRWKKIQEYQANILKASSADRVLLVTGFTQVFKDKMDIDELIRKLSRPSGPYFDEADPTGPDSTKEEKEDTKNGKNN